MASIILGIGSSHTPLLTLETDDWRQRAAVDRANPRLNLSDGRWVTYDQLLAQVGPRFADACTPERMRQMAQLCEEALERLADALEAARPDVVLIIGDDEGELFTASNRPAFAIFHGETLMTSDLYGDASSPEWIRTMGRAYLMDKRHPIVGHARIAGTLIEGLTASGIEVAMVGNPADGSKRGVGHAFGFVVKRLFRNRPYPVVPVLVNTYFRPNVPTSARAYDIGVAIRNVIQDMHCDARVAVIASGGLSHFVVDPELDNRVLEAIRKRDKAALRAIPNHALNSGSSEILNWVMAAGALAALPAIYSEYVPMVRTPAGTGIGAAFAIWKG